MNNHFDVVIVGAGISGISAAWHLQKLCPTRTYAVLERRENIGGTWDLFRYPGIRSDSDMHTMGFGFRPWTEPKIISEGDKIRDYVQDTADDADITPHIQFEHQLLEASWSSEKSAWTLSIKHKGKKKSISCNFLQMCSGYYDYDEGYLPKFKGYDDFKGSKIHPQFWPEDLDYKDKEVVIIGSGATAVTLLPNMIDKTKHITMVQRSPTYMVSRPAIDKVAVALRKFLPEVWVYKLIRWRNILLQMLFFRMAKKSPEKVKNALLTEAQKLLPEGYDMDTHFTPKYNPWDQRLCLVPDADFFDAIKSGAASVVTSEIDSFTEKGIKLTSGKELKADIIITATGLNMRLLKGVEFEVDGRAAPIKDHVVYKGCMLSNIPNMTFTMGYSNASWTLKADLTSRWACRILKHMAKVGASKVMPYLPDDADLALETVMNLNSGYVQRAIDHVPKQGAEAPWLIRHNYLQDTLIMRWKGLEDGVLEFSSPEITQASAVKPAA